MISRYEKIIVEALVHQVTVWQSILF